MQDILKALEIKKQAYATGVAEKELHMRQKNELEQELEKTKVQLLNDQLIRSLLETTSKMAREKARELLETTATTALQYVFGQNFSASIELKTSAGKSSADIYVVTDMGNGNVVKARPENSCGGGVVDIVSIALRIAMKKLMNVNGPLILDEPGKHVSAEYSVKLAEFLKYISVKFGIQIIFVTHNEDLKSIADVALMANIHNGATVMAPIDAIEDFTT